MHLEKPDFKKCLQLLFTKPAWMLSCGPVTYKTIRERIKFHMEHISHDSMGNAAPATRPHSYDRTATTSQLRLLFFDVRVQHRTTASNSPRKETGRHARSSHFPLLAATQPGDETRAARESTIRSSSLQRHLEKMKPWHLTMDYLQNYTLWDSVHLERLDVQN